MSETESVDKCHDNECGTSTADESELKLYPEDAKEVKILTKFPKSKLKLSPQLARLVDDYFDNHIAKIVKDATVLNLQNDKRRWINVAEFTNFYLQQNWTVDYAFDASGYTYRRLLSVPETTPDDEMQEIEDVLGNDFMVTRSPEGDEKAFRFDFYVREILMDALEENQITVSDKKPIWLFMDLPRTQSKTNMFSDLNIVSTFYPTGTLGLLEPSTAIPFTRGNSVWDSECRGFLRDNPGQEMRGVEFASAMRLVDSVITEQVGIVQGFKVTGSYPPNSPAVVNLRKALFAGQPEIDAQMTNQDEEFEVSTGIEGISNEIIVSESCPICNDRINGNHYGIACCESCKTFFKRVVMNTKNYVCKRGGSCPMTVTARKECAACRFDKCLEKGMKLNSFRPVRTIANPQRSKPSSAATSEPRFVCRFPSCHYRTNFRMTFVRHVQKHSTNKQRYKCKYCDQDFAHDSARVRHQRRDHAEEP